MGCASSSPTTTESPPNNNKNSSNNNTTATELKKSTSSRSTTTTTTATNIKKISVPGPVTSGRSERAASTTKKAPQDQKLSPSSSSSHENKKKDLANQLKVSLHRQNSGPQPDLDEEGNLKPHEVEKRRTISKQVQSYHLYRSNCTLEYAYCTQRGYYPNQPNKLNQDQFSISHNFAGIEGDSFFAVYDGHGPMGDHFAVYAKNNLPLLMEKYIRQERVAAHKLRNESLPPEQKYPFNPKLFPMISTEDYQRVSKLAHEECNKLMIDTQPFVSLSGTTAISAGFHNGHLIISNVGDSRAILGYRDEKQSDNNTSSPIVAIPLSKDQTPWRKDERLRIEKAGGRVLTLAQLQGKVKVSEDDERRDRYLGELGDIDEAGDPPRVWLKDQEMPGTSFTRALGDSMADEVGVCAEPECYSKEITEEDEILVLASDGVFEFVPNQVIIDIASECNNPVKACEKIVDLSYSKWLEYENRTDDITLIVIYLRHGKTVG